MPATCKICRHDQRDEIERALLAGDPFRHIASRFGTSTGSLQRHKASCVSGALVKAQTAAEVVRGDSLMQRIESALTRIRDLGLEAERLYFESQNVRDKGTALTAVCALSREQRGYVEILVKLIGTLHSPETAAEALGRQFQMTGAEVREVFESRQRLRAMSDQELENYLKEKLHVEFVQ